MTEKQWHATTVEAVLKELETDPTTGLVDEEAARRIEKCGYNELKREERISPLTLFLNQFKNILIIILLFTSGLSVAVGEALDAILILVIVVFCAVLGFIQEYRAERALEALKGMLAPTVTVCRAGKEGEILSKDLVPGDILILEAGDRIPADARLIQAFSLKCDEAALTGESVPVGKHTEAMADEVRVADRRNIVYAGTTVSYGRGKAVVVATGMTTEFGKIAEQVTTIGAEKTPLERRTEEIGKWLGFMALGICFLVAGISLLREAWVGKLDLQFFVTIVMFAIALAVAAVPEALAAIVTGALAIGMHQMAKRNALIRKMPAVETLGCTTVICSDKTGTLTKGEMTIRRVYVDGKSMEVTGTGYVPEGEFRLSGSALGYEDQGLQLLLLGGVLCNDAALEQREGRWLVKGDPTEGAMVVAAAKAHIDQVEAGARNPRIEEIPFSSERKRMTTIHRMEDGRTVAFMKGASEFVLERCSHVFADGHPKPLTPEERRRILEVNEQMAQGALRVLGFAYRELSHEYAGQGDEVEQEMMFVGLVGMMDPPREEAIEAIKVCKNIHIRPIMITGDHQITAVAIAREIGIYRDGDRVLTGDEMEGMPIEELERIVDTVTVYARVSPTDKLKIVRAWKNKGEVVAMTGDGVNDAPALKHADIGIAMGITGTDVAKEAADMVLSDDNFATIVNAIERGRWIYDNIKKYLTYLLRCNITEVVVIGGVVLLMGPEYLPLLPAAILYINLATDGLPALALGVAPPDPDIMQRPPRDPNESVFTKDVKAFIALALFIEIPFFFFLFFHELTDITQARTDIFFLFVIVELVIAINFRSMRYSVFKLPPHKWLLIAIFWEVVLVAVLIQFDPIREAFGIQLPDIKGLAIILGFSVLVFCSMEVIKALVRRHMPVGKGII
jgi:P-type Ca2+ transporter type 2C